LTKLSGKRPRRPSCSATNHPSSSHCLLTTATMAPSGRLISSELAASYL
jgi:hypothetical protein